MSLPSPVEAPPHVDVANTPGVGLVRLRMAALCTGALSDIAPHAVLTSTGGTSCYDQLASPRVPATLLTCFNPGSSGLVADKWSRAKFSRIVNDLRVARWHADVDISWVDSVQGETLPRQMELISY
ncbi:hypothetical protein Bbelb_323790 [Branchiostoma belcheri]|nr:hypothetical protein Bbelb_440370 [Branchiostoma belcheri]KAI8490016.1 hypothetical protein Bbelb_323770 [Branchiostoma belcheri]KAI8490018.1 hypothetical protein Bbelb_323790 [Branchiostoma belcheri]